MIYFPTNRYDCDALHTHTHTNTYCVVLALLDGVCCARVRAVGVFDPFWSGSRPAARRPRKRAITRHVGKTTCRGDVQRSWLIQFNAINRCTHHTNRHSDTGRPTMDRRL